MIDAVHDPVQARHVDSVQILFSLLSRFGDQMRPQGDRERVDRHGGQRRGEGRAVYAEMVAERTVDHRRDCARSDRAGTIHSAWRHGMSVTNSEMAAGKAALPRSPEKL